MTARLRVVHADDAKVCAYCDHLHARPACPRCGCEGAKPYHPPAPASPSLMSALGAAVDRARAEARGGAHGAEGGQT